MSKLQTVKVKARSKGTMNLRKKKVDFTPSAGNRKRMESIYREAQLNDLNNIVRFNSID